MTERLLVRRLVATDATAMHEVYGDPRVMRWVDDGRPRTLAECEAWVEVTLRNYSTRGYGMWALVDRADGANVGFAGLVHPGGQSQPELKYALRFEYWGQGLATEAAKALLEFAGRELGLAEVIATTAPMHLASHRVLEKAGMGRGELRLEDGGEWTQYFVWHAPGS